ncbi:GNAT family N-acetyltransferase [Micromonospora sp. WMMA1998]|uniref:GNAT family N-acetyltransferase n=1 Tax=Micromonospora sp. WMMA1998 TaxID=3015167 RepID=UPI00248A9329|nr:GNAT family N-acetyltransferase [Micromonospora sp. WMMA1998]WBC15452.1 GNAT family N-acetyltransferase [Micromonospora sp. WMMA1998]
MPQPWVRPMRVEDVPAAERASAVTFLEGDRLSRRVSEPEVQPRSAAVGKQWIDRMSYLVETDPGGCWVAVDGEDLVGFAISQNRGRVWYLATYGVLPGHQGHGLGRRLMDAVLAHADGRPGLFSSTVHPGATRRYRLAGFLLYPQMRMVGTVDRSTLPAVPGLSEGDGNDIGWMDRLDESRRGAGHGPDHEYMLRRLRLVVSRRPGRLGYVYLDEDTGQPKLLAAQDPRTASALLWEALAGSRGPTLVNCITTANHWAVDVGLAARLDLGQEGYLALRGLPEPAPYLASGHFL